ncbi:MAG: hypothetical protein US54_C0035G0010 [Candidatus Roizmanbacteria bacterium GW2011_GWA2_37_7]|uniref:Uncharacterized protein n=1 Tax=Candidatus Roizmanbacteria bacterium GW2011_GWA2_37_7 TaxID=1618481 RepID=A0A0G0H2D7_9BACT|nr:MAG: hypothetical protein US54_C0035G0010 [Candidatus Roizmanbacteria bacterium GW2011_GWA2_37_7]
MTKVQDIIKEKPYLAWYVKNVENLSDESTLEHVLTYGNWEDVQTFIKIKGFNETRTLFNISMKQKRANYPKNIKHYFNLYFNTHRAS